jgi:hypothetical protein
LWRSTGALDEDSRKRPVVREKNDKLGGEMKKNVNLSEKLKTFSSLKVLA